MSFLPNGRPATQADLAGLRAHIDTRFDRFEARYDELDSRVRSIERDDARDDGRDEAVAAAKSTERAVKEEQGVSRRWRIGIAMGLFIAISGNLVAILK